MNTDLTFVVGAGPSLSAVSGLGRIAGITRVIVCNRAIEACPADYWVWVDRFHHERSRWHLNAKRAIWVGPSDQPVLGGHHYLLYEPSPTLNCEPSQLYLRGGTLTVAAHFAVRLGARCIVFVACDSWDHNRDRYHEWDGAPLDGNGLAVHQTHLEQIVEGVHDLVRCYPNIEFLDATEGRQHLGFPRVGLDRIIEKTPKKKEIKMAKRQEATITRDESVPMGYGKLISVMPMGASAGVLWFEDSAGTIRALRVKLGVKEKFGLEIDGQAQIVRA